jgi:hypothetical protein
MPYDFNLANDSDSDTTPPPVVYSAPDTTPSPLDDFFASFKSTDFFDSVNSTQVEWILPKGLVAKKIPGNVAPRSTLEGLEFGPCAMAVVEPFDSHMFMLETPKKERWLATVAAGIRNEGPYLVEFINHHLHVGFEHFVFCDDKSQDNTDLVLQPYVEAGMVTLLYDLDQWACHRAASELLQNKTEWIYAADVDSMLVPSLPHHTLHTLLDGIAADSLAIT